MPLHDCTGLEMPYQTVIAGGRANRIGSAKRAVLEVMASLPLNHFGQRRIARSDLIASFKMGQRGESGRSSKDLAVNRLIIDGALARDGYQMKAESTGRMSETLVLTPLGFEIAETLGLIGEKNVS